MTWSARNRFIVILLYLFVTGAGIYSVMHLPVDAIPDLSENQVIVFTEWMGRSPEVVEQQVTYPISSALQGLPEVKAVRATSMFGMSFVFVIFNDNTDLYFARNRVVEKLALVRAQLPPSATPILGSGRQRRGACLLVHGRRKIIRSGHVAIHSGLVSAQQAGVRRRRCRDCQHRRLRKTISGRHRPSQDEGLQCHGERSGISHPAE